MLCRIGQIVWIGILWGQSPDPLKVLNTMLDRIGALQRLRYELKKYERVKGKVLLEHMYFKLQRNPFSVYGYQYSPRKGVEVLFPAEKGSSRILVNPNSFPYVSLTLDPFGDLVLEGQHQTIFAVGYDQIRSLLLAAREKYRAQLMQLVKYEGTLLWDGNRCYKIALYAPNYRIVSYTVAPNENLFTIAEKLKVGWYKILELNNLSSPKASLKVGQTLKVPSDYGKVIRLLIDEQRYIPLMVEVEDELGLYERYEYYKVEVDPNFSEMDFSRDNPEYDF
ncbi:MAG: DUF1571 domain-containing protein [Bacteroidia bacterium]|nr:DUF1571 domain-containing protein [Bacteroidia bacterium]MDW8134527.1 DUF1571 domain-containing protein [Bacteroidia bacterium]